MNGWKKKYLWVAIPALLLTVGAIGISELSRSKSIVVPAGTEIRVRLDRSISSAHTTLGDPFHATIAEPIVLGGRTVIPKGAPVNGRIVYARPSGRLRGVAQLRLALEAVQVNDHQYELHTSTFSRRGGNHRKRNWAIIGGGAGGGALIGALAAGGKGALIGGPVGAGAGVAAAMLTGRKNIVLPAETLLTFTLTSPIDVKTKS